MKIQVRSIGQGIGIGLLLAALIAAPFTAIDWYQNPGGIFRGSGGTDFQILWETAFSWFWPSALLTVPLAIVIRLWLAHRRAPI